MPKTVGVLRKEFNHASTDRGDDKNSSTMQSYTCHSLDVLTDGALFSVTDPRDRVYQYAVKDLINTEADS